jgi:hypothetical protein
VDGMGQETITSVLPMSLGHFDRYFGRFQIEHYGAANNAVTLL